MRDRNVIALKVVVDINLPVAFDDVVAALGQFEPFELEATRLIRNFAKNRCKRFRVLIEIDEDEVAPGVQSQWNHAHGAAVKKLHAVHIGRADEFSFERIGPAVILAAHNVFAAAAKCDWSGAMPANVAEGAQRFLLVSNNKNR